jgi:signal transduction histidine kinase
LDSGKGGAVTFRTKLFFVSSLTVAGAVALVTGAVSLSARRSFDRMDESRRQGLIQEFQRQIAVQGEELESAVRRAAGSEPVLRIGIEADKPEPDFASFLDEGRIQAEAQALDFLDVVTQDLTVISSAHSPARFGYKAGWLITPEDLAGGKPFLTRISLTDGTAVALAAVSPVAAGSRRVYVAGAKRLDASFLKSLGAAPGARAMIRLATGELFGAAGALTSSAQLDFILDRLKRTGREASGMVQWSANPAGVESVVALPLQHGSDLLGALLVGTSLRDQIELERSILCAGVLVGGSGILLGALIAWWTTARVSRPVAQLVAGVQSVAGGDWTARVAAASEDEIGQLALAFNRMTEQLIEQRDRTLQAERVAAWREVARRLAHELKNPLFPLQITVENLQRAREQRPDEFDEVFRESTATLLVELHNLKLIIGRFSDFAKMPRPELEMVNVNAVVDEVMRLYEPQFHANGRPKIQPVLELAVSGAEVKGDPLLLNRALSNLVLNAMDAMPSGGVLRFRTERIDDRVRIEVADSGQGLSEEECARLFTPYYTTKRHGTGLGLAIVQSVVSDHGGRISVSSVPGQGTVFTIDLPARRDE